MRRQQTSIPSEHLVMIYIGFAILLLAGLAYLFAPANKSEAFLAIMTLASGFLFGKFTNGYNRNTHEFRFKEPSERPDNRRENP